VLSLDHLLTARVPGVSVVQASGIAASGSQIRLRGNTSVSLSNEPLVYLDGVRVRSDGYPRNAPPSGEFRRGPNDVPSPLNDINPADIERVEIVRGPAATTLYGTDAATGVIQIFTRRGNAGRALWNSELTFGGDRVQRFGTKGEPYMRLDPWLRTAERGGGSISVSGGDDVRYYLSTSYAANEGVLPDDMERRALFRGNLDFSPSRKLALAWSSSFARNNIRNTPAGENSQGITMNAYRGDNNYTGIPGKESLDRILEWDITTRIHHLVSGLTATYTTSPRVTHVVTVGLDRADLELRSLRPYGFVFTPLGILSDQTWVASTLTTDYAGRVALHRGSSTNATLSWGAQAISSDVNSLAGYSETFPGPGEPTLSSGALTLAFETRSRTVNAGGFSQLQLGFGNRLFMTAGLRLDGSSVFGRSLGLQAYPRVNASYVISDEKFWPWTGMSLRLRTAYGHAGRAPGAFDAERTWVQLGFQGQPALAPGTVGNSNLGPERTAESEAGFNLSTSGERLRVDFTWYRRTTSDALFPVTQTPSLGFLGTQLENVGKVRASGIELAIDASIVRNESVEWTTGLDIATNKSKVLTLGGAPPFVIGDVGHIAEGLPTPAMIGVRVLNPKEIADPVLEQNHVYGPNLPTHVIGLRSSLRFRRGVEVSGRAEYSGGNYLYDNASRSLAQNNSWVVCDKAYKEKADGHPEMLNAWERLYCNPLTAPQDGPIWPADFVRLRSLSLTMPFRGAMMRARRASMTLSMRNVMLWKNSDMLVFDPEMVGKNGMNSVVRAIEAQVPSPMGFMIAVRASYW
jgi:outer membrane receptor protein involved in Fe transport